MPLNRCIMCGYVHHELAFHPPSKTSLGSQPFLNHGHKPLAYDHYPFVWSNSAGRAPARPHQGHPRWKNRAARMAGWGGRELPNRDQPDGPANAAGGTLRPSPPRPLPRPQASSLAVPVPRAIVSTGPRRERHLPALALNRLATNSRSQRGFLEQGREAL